MPVFLGGLAADVDYMDMAVSLSTPHPTDPYTQRARAGRQAVRDGRPAAGKRWRACRDASFRLLVASRVDACTAADVLTRSLTGGCLAHTGSSGWACRAVMSCRSRWVEFVRTNEQVQRDSAMTRPATPSDPSTPTRRALIGYLSERFVRDGRLRLCGRCDACPTVVDRRR